MANATIYTLESVNMICGDVGGSGTVAPGLSTHLTIKTMKLPAIEENYVDHMPGGAPLAIEIGMHYNKLECTFVLAGFNPDVQRLVGRSNLALQNFTANGLVRDRRSGRALHMQAILQGRLGRVNPTEFSKGGHLDHEYAIRSIIHYDLRMREDVNSNAMRVIYRWDFFESDFFVGDENINSDMISMLEIPTAPGVNGGFGA